MKNHIMNMIKTYACIILCLLLVSCRNKNYEVPLDKFLFSRCHVDEIETYDLPWNKRGEITRKSGFDNKNWLITKKDLANGITGEWLIGLALRNKFNIKDIDGVSNFTTFKENDYEYYEVGLVLESSNRIESHSIVELYNEKNTLSIMLTNEYLHLKIDSTLDKYYFLPPGSTEILHGIAIRKMRDRKLIFYNKSHIATIKNKELDLNHFKILIKPYPYINFNRLTISELYI